MSFSEFSYLINSLLDEQFQFDALYYLLLDLSIFMTYIRISQPIAISRLRLSMHTYIRFICKTNNERLKDSIKMCGKYLRVCKRLWLFMLNEFIEEKCAKIVSLLLILNLLDKTDEGIV